MCNLIRLCRGSPVSLNSEKNHSTQLALTILMDKLMKSVDNGDHVICVFLDFSKAFDTVDHLILLNKLHHYGIRWSALDWFWSYLSNRQQFVTYNYVSSDTKKLNVVFPMDLYWVHSYFSSISMILPLFVSRLCQCYLLMILIYS